MTSFREQKKQQTRLRIAAAAVDLFVHGGSEAATISAISAAAGVSPRTFHNYFSSRDEAFFCYGETLGSELCYGMQQAPAQATPAAIMEHSVLHVLSFFRNEADLQRLFDFTQSLPLFLAMMHQEDAQRMQEQLVGGLQTEAARRQEQKLNVFEATLVFEGVLTAAKVSLESFSGNKCFSSSDISTTAFDHELFAERFHQAIHYLGSAFS